jgi:hypothetical protein
MLHPAAPGVARGLYPPRVIYCIHRWSVKRDRVADHQEAVRRMLDHVRSTHPLVRETAFHTVLWGSDVGRPGRIYVEAFETESDYERSEATESTPECDAVWAPIFETIVDGSHTTSIWKGALVDAWTRR